MRYAITCPGQGFVRGQLLRPHIKYKPLFQRSLEIIDDCLQESFSEKLFHENESWLLNTSNAQPAIMATTYIINEILVKQFNLNLINSNAVLLGHSLGEYTALLLNQKLSLPTAIKLARLRGQLMERLQSSTNTKFTMKAIMFRGDNFERIQQICNHNEVLANINSPQQLVLSGPKTTVDETINQINASKRLILKVVDLPVTIPFHHKSLSPIQSELQAFLESESTGNNNNTYNPGITEMVSNLTGELAQDDKLLPNTICLNSCPVQWVKSLQTLSRMGITEVINLGPGQILHNINSKFDFTNYSLDSLNTSEIESIQHLA